MFDETISPFRRSGLRVRLRMPSTILTLRRTMFVFLCNAFLRAHILVGRIYGSLQAKFIMTRCLPTTIHRRSTFSNEIHAIVGFNETRTRNGHRRRLLRLRLMRTILICRLILCLRQVRLLSTLHRFTSTNSTIRIRRTRRLNGRTKRIRICRRRITARRTINGINVLRRTTRSLGRRRTFYRFHEEFQRNVRLIRHKRNGLSATLLRLRVHHTPSIRRQVRQNGTAASVRTH